MSEYKSPDQILADINAQLEIQRAQDTRDIRELVEAGANQSENYQEKMAEVVKAVGHEAGDAIAKIAGGFEAGILIMDHIAENPDLAVKLSKMTPAAAAATMAKLETRLMPNAPETSDGIPSWRKSHRSGERHSLGDEVTDDKRWAANFRKKYYENGAFQPHKLFNR
jgi:hypothetical protein